MIKQGKYIPGVRVNKPDLARIIGVEQQMVDIWLCKGLPYIKRPKPRVDGLPDEREWLFDTAEVIEWCISTPHISNYW